MDLDFMDPTGSADNAAFEVAGRLGDVKGKTVGLLDNGKTNAEKFLWMVGNLLVEKYGAGELKMFHKAALSRPAPREVLDAIIGEADLAVTGIGDCGSCSTNSVHDAIEIEKGGVPAIAICTEAFLPGLDTLVRMRGMPDYRFAVVPHPLGVLFDDELQGRAEIAAPQVVAIATGRDASRSKAAE